MPHPMYDGSRYDERGVLRLTEEEWRDAELGFDLAEDLGFDGTLRDGNPPATSRRWMTSSHPSRTAKTP